MNKTTTRQDFSTIKIAFISFALLAVYILVELFA